MSINFNSWIKQTVETKKTIKADEVGRIMSKRGTLWSEYRTPSFTKQKIWTTWCYNLGELANELDTNVEFGIISHNAQMFTIGLTYTYNGVMYFVRVTKDNLYFYRIEK